MIETSPAQRITAAASLVLPAVTATAAAVEVDLYAGLSVGTITFAAVLLSGWVFKARPWQTLLLIAACFFAAGVAGAKEFFATLLGGEEA